MAIASNGSGILILGTWLRPFGKIKQCLQQSLIHIFRSQFNIIVLTDRTIIIKPADTGGAAVILSTEHYKTMIMQHLDDAGTYKKLDLNICMKITKI